MFRKLIAAVGLSVAATARAVANPPYSPYDSEAANTIYNLLFCDNPASFKAKPGEKPSYWQAALNSAPADVEALRALASDATQEGRIRFLAFSRLRELGNAVQPKILLGVIVEVPLSEGLDALAAFSEGGIRYVNQSGKLVVMKASQVSYRWSSACLLSLSRS